MWSFLQRWICLYRHCKTCGLLYVWGQKTSEKYEIKRVYWRTWFYCIWKNMHTSYIVYTCLFFQSLVANLGRNVLGLDSVECNLYFIFRHTTKNVLFLFCPLVLIFKVNVAFPRAFAPYGSLFWSVFTFCFCFVSSHAAGLRQPYWSADIDRRWRNRPDFS